MEVTISSETLQQIRKTIKSAFEDGSSLILENSGVQKEDFWFYCKDGRGYLLGYPSVQQKDLKIFFEDGGIHVLGNSGVQQKDFWFYCE
jgi:hypothetical protein